MQQQVTTVQQTGQHVMMDTPHNDDTSHKPNYQSQSSYVLGGLQVAVGVLAVVFNIAAVVTDTPQSDKFQGVWCGIFFVLTGIVGIVAASQKNTCAIIAFMTLNILCTILCVVLLIISAVGIDYCNSSNWTCIIRSHRYNRNAKTHNALNGVLVVLALLEVIISIWSAAICCAVTCCGLQANRRIQTVHFINQPSHPQVMVITGGLQPMAEQWTQQPTYYIQTGGMQPAGQPPAYTTGPSSSYVVSAPGPSLAVTAPVPQAPPVPVKPTLY